MTDDDTPTAGYPTPIDIEAAREANRVTMLGYIVVALILLGFLFWGGWF